jgi:hypothetical protein
VLGPDRDRQDEGHQQLVSAPEHAALCAVPATP